METLIHIGAFMRIPASKILLVEAAINYSTIYLIDGSKLCTATTLKIIEDRLSITNCFARVHRSYLINKTYLQACKPGVYYLDQQIVYKVSRRKQMKEAVSFMRKS